MTQQQKQVLLQLKAERDRYKDTIRLLRDGEVKVSKPLTIAKKIRADNNGAMGKTQEDYNVLYNMLKYENQKLKVEVKRLKASLRFMVLLIIYLIALLYTLKSPTSGKKILPGL